MRSEVPNKGLEWTNLVLGLVLVCAAFAFGGLAMSRLSILKRAINTARAGFVFVGMLSPAHAAYQYDAARVLPGLPISRTAHRESRVLTAQLPWLASVGHRQPHQADVPRHEAVSAWEREQQKFDRELDQKLIICRGC